MFERIEKCIEDHRSICHRFYLEVHRQLISKNEKIHITKILLFSAELHKDNFRVETIEFDMKLKVNNMGE